MQEGGTQLKDVRKACMEYQVEKRMDGEGTCKGKKRDA